MYSNINAGDYIAVHNWFLRYPMEDIVYGIVVKKSIYILYFKFIISTIPYNVKNVYINSILSLSEDDFSYSTVRAYLCTDKEVEQLLLTELLNG